MRNWVRRPQAVMRQRTRPISTRRHCCGNSICGYFHPWRFCTSCRSWTGVMLAMRAWKAWQTILIWVCAANCNDSQNRCTNSNSWRPISDWSNVVLHRLRLIRNPMQHRAKADYPPDLVAHPHTGLGHCCHTTGYCQQLRRISHVAHSFGYRGEWTVPGCGVLSVHVV